MELDMAKQAVAYYCTVTGNLWDTFYSNLDEAMSMPLSTQTGDLWLIHALMNKVVESGISINEFKVNKDAVKALFDEEGRKLAGEFFTPEVWAEEGRKLLDKYIPNWRETHYVWEPSSGSGNLIRNAKITPEHLFSSTLQEDDVIMQKNTAELKDATIFQLDFLSAYDSGDFINEFTDNLPENLQDVLENDKPLVIYANPPYKTGQANNTEVGRYMSRHTATSGDWGVDFSRPAYDLFYQFCFQFMNLVRHHKLSNTYYCFFGPLTFFTGAGANILLKEFERCFEFVDGMCISAQEFSDTSDSILWGIGCSLWKARGDYMRDMPESESHKDILLSKKYLMPDGSVGTEGKVLYEPPRIKLSDWVEPSATDPDVGLKTDMPLMTSHLTFKGGDANEKIVHKVVKFPTDVLGTLMLQNTLTRSSDQRAILSMPATIQYSYITRENFWRCVASFAFRCCFEAGWSIAKKEISAPSTKVEGYDIWLKNALVLFLFEYKAMQNSIRGARMNNSDQTWNFNNKLFYLSADEVRANCHDEVILKDLEAFPPQNQFMLEQIQACEQYWAPPIKQLFDWCKGYTLATYDYRKKVDYKGSLDCWDAGFQQIRSNLWDEEKLNPEMTKLLVNARDYLAKDLDKFGFVSEIEDTSDL